MNKLFNVDDEVYPPSEDTYLLLEAALREVEDDDEVLEVGAGSGFIVEKIKNKVKCIIGTDISPYAVKMAKARGIDVVRTDIARGIKKQFSLIIFNPPYLPTSEIEQLDDWLEKALNGGESGRDVIYHFLDSISDNLQSDGRILLLVSSLSGIDEVLKYAEKQGFKWTKLSEKRLFFEKLEVYRLVRSR